MATALQRTDVELEQRRATAAATRAAADLARQEAEQLAAAAEQAEQQQIAPVGDLYSLLRQLTGEVAAARLAAVDAVRTGNEPALEAWLRYRRTRAVNRGRWDALSGLYAQRTGRPAPPGAWGPPIVHDRSGIDDTMAPEDFHTFLHNTLAVAEPAIRIASRDATGSELEAAQG